MSFPPKIQDEVIPVVSGTAPSNRLEADLRLDPILGTGILRFLPPLQARLGCFHVQRRSGGPQGVDGRDTTSQSGAERKGGGRRY